MLQYKTVCLPEQPYKDVSKKEFDNGITVESGNKAVAPIGFAVQEEAKGGWILHSVHLLPQRIMRKKSITEMIFGWIPFLGRFLCPRISETQLGCIFNVYVLMFVKEV